MANDKTEPATGGGTRPAGWRAAHPFVAKGGKDTVKSNAVAPDYAPDPSRATRPSRSYGIDQGDQGK